MFGCSVYVTTVLREGLKPTEGSPQELSRSETNRQTDSLPDSTLGGNVINLGFLYLLTSN